MKTPRLPLAELYVAVADGGVGELVGVGAGDHGGVFGAGGDAGGQVFGGLVCLAQGERDEVVGVGLERGDDGGGDGLQHAVEIEIGDAGFAEGGEANAVGRLPDLGVVRNLRCANKFR